MERATGFKFPACFFKLNATPNNLNHVGFNLKKQAGNKLNSTPNNLNHVGARDEVINEILRN